MGLGGAREKHESRGDLMIGRRQSGGKMAKRKQGFVEKYGCEGETGGERKKRG